MFETQAAQLELEDFKAKVLALVRKNGGKATFNDVCNQFKELYGANIRRWFKESKIGKIIILIQEQCADILEMDNTSRMNQVILYELGKAPKKVSFNNQLQGMSSEACERQLEQSVAHLQGSSKITPIEVEEGEDDTEEIRIKRPPNRNIWKTLAEKDGFDLQAVVENFHLYRDFQMVHIAYCKLRVIVMFGSYGKTSIRLHFFSSLFKEMYRENFFNRSVLKYYISDTDTKDDTVKNFLKRFCGDFLTVSDDLIVNIRNDLSALHAKYLDQLITTVGKIEGIGYTKMELNPTPPEMLLLGKTVENEKPIDVVRVPDRHRGFTYMTEFPDPNNRSLHGRERPTIAEINEHVNQIRNKVCREGRMVKLTEVLGELCAFYKVPNARELHPVEREIRRDIDISAIYDIMRLQGKVNAFIQAFMQFRNVCTLHELEEEICKMEGKSSFSELRLGPLQKQLLVYEFFQFPPTKESIPTITTLEVFRVLWKCISAQSKSMKSGRERFRQKEGNVDKLTLPEFMQFFIEKHGFSDPFESGVRIGSIAVAIQVVRKVWFGDMHHIREITHKFYHTLCSDFDQHLMHTAKQIIKNGNTFPGDSQTLVQRISGMNLVEGFSEMYNMLQNMKREACKTLPGTAHLINFSDITMNALSIIQKDNLMSRVFHVLLSTAPLKTLDKDDVSILKYLGFKSAVKEMVEEEQQSSKSKDVKTQRVVTPKAKVIEVSSKWISNIPEWNISTLSHIESQIVAEINKEYTAFDDLGHGSFLKFIATDKNLLEIIETAVKSDVSGSLSVGKNVVLEFIHQCDDINSKDDVKTALSLQFHIGEIEKPVQKLIDQTVSKKQSSTSPRYLQALLCGSDYHKNITDCCNNETVSNHAKRRILAAPFLADVGEWTGWNIMFQNKLGDMKEFLVAHFKEKDHDFLFLETKRDSFIKVMKDCTADWFLWSAKDLDPLMSSACLVSILSSSGHISNVPIALLSNHAQNVFLEFAGRADELLKFCHACFQLIPFEYLCCIISKIFLDPLSKLHGRLNVSSILLNACERYSKERSVLHALGFHLSVNEWINDYEDQLNGYPKQQPEDERADDTQVVADVSKQDITSSTVPNEQMDVAVDEIVLQAVEPITPPDVVADAVAASSIITTETGDVADGSLEKPSEVVVSCQQIIEDIRREQFGIGQIFGEQEQKIINIHREREGRSLHRLSRELYTKDSHFVLELIQNADDNDYPLQFMGTDASEKPTVAFIVDTDKVTILNNEVGFMEKNIKALCDVGKSTKGIHRKGYIGQKGIGFKSVFRVTDCPEIHSNGYHIKFDASSGPNGYILPQWIDGSEDIQYNPPNEKQKFSWTTKIVLHLKKEMQHTKLTSRFHDIHPSLLMFLNRLHKIIIDDRVSGTVKVMHKEKVDENLIRLSENRSSTLWFVVNDEITIDLREDIKTTDISVAFPIQKDHVREIRTELLPSQPVFAFLPLRSYGFKFIIQADFEVPSSREDIDKDSSWNQCILQHLPSVVVKAFYSFKKHKTFTNLDGVVAYFKFMDLEDHVLGIFKQVARQILKGLQREPCLPVQDKNKRDDGEVYKWAVPNSVVMSKSESQSVITSSILHQHLGLHYIHKDIQENISNAVYLSLGVEKLTLEQLVEIAKTVVRIHQCDKEEMNRWIGKWLYVVYTSMQENCDYSEKTLDLIKSLKIFALCDGNFVSLKEHVVFFPVESVKEQKKANKTLRLIENDLTILSHALTSSLDIVEQQQVIRLLQDLGVKTMTPYDLIHNYIIPLFKSGKWKEKAEDLVVACVIYLRQQFSLDQNLFEIDDIKDGIALLTNKGFKQPANDVIYLSTDFGNQLNLGKVLSACDWTLISSSYLTSHSSIDRKAWQDFFLTLGLKMFVSVRKCERTLHRSDLTNSVWDKYSETWPKTDDETYVISDLVCPEFDSLIKSRDNQQIQTFVLSLDKNWDVYFKRYDLTKPTCLIKNTKGKTIGCSTYSSIFLKMRISSWIQSSANILTIHVPCDLFYANDEIMGLLANKVQYMSSKIQNKDFISTLGVQTELKFERFIEEFKKWREEVFFSSTYVHTQNVYKYMEDRMDKHSEIIMELLDEPFFFLLSGHCSQQLSNASVAEGKFYHKKDVCWEDPSGIIIQNADGISKRRILLGYYPPATRDLFIKRFGVDQYPSSAEYLSVLSNIANKTTLPDKEACQQIFTLFSLLAQKAIYCDQLDELVNWGWKENVADQASIYYDLKDYINPDVCLFTDHKIFPTSTNNFVSLAEKPILVLDEDLARIYKKDDNLPLMYIKDITRILKVNNSAASRTKRNEERELEKKVIQILSFFKACKIPLLREVVEQGEVAPGLLTRGCKTWQQILHDISPYIQRYIYTNHYDIYEELRDRNFSKYLYESCFFQVKTLEVVYRLNDRDNVNIRLPKVCNVQDMSESGRAYIYISAVADHGKSKYEETLTDLMELFVGKSESLKEDLSDFVLFLTTVVSNKEDHLRRKRIPHLPADEVLWEHPEPEQPAPPPQRPRPKLAVAPIPKGEEGQKSITSWPPRNPNSSGTKTKPESVSKEDWEILDKWQAPEAPHEVNRKSTQDEAVAQSSTGVENSSEVMTSAENKRPTDGLKRKRTESDSSSSQNAEQESDQQFKPRTKKPFTTSVDDQNVNTPGHSYDADESFLPTPPPMKSKFDPRLLATKELLDQYEDLPILLDDDVEEGEVNFLQRIKPKDKDQENPIGQIGEQIVYQHMCSVYKDDIKQGKLAVLWLNEQDETGDPFDIKIEYAEHLKLNPVYVEVKTTFMDEKKEFEISSQQLKFAIQQGPCFHLYRLSGLSHQRQMKLKRLVNLAAYMDNKAVKLYMVL